jgi:hypothetical protein
MFFYYCLVILVATKCLIQQRMNKELSLLSIDDFNFIVLIDVDTCKPNSRLTLQVARGHLAIAIAIAL